MPEAPSNLRLSERPLLFLDVDGVLNTFPHDESECVRHDIDGGPMFVSVRPGTRERVQRLLEVYDPVWATAWQGSAHRAWKPILGLSDMPWQYIAYGNLKLPEILRVAGQRRWAWVDDDAQYELDKLGWSEGKVPGLIVQPVTEIGLLDEHVERLIAYAGADHA